MPHLVIDYSANLEPYLQLTPLFKQMHQLLIDKQLFPTGGIRSRARCIEHYYFADGQQNDAGIHVELKLSAARPTELRQTIGKEIFAVVQAYCQPLRQQHPWLALSMEVSLIDPDTFFNDNSIHQRFQPPEVPSNITSQRRKP